MSLNQRLVTDLIFAAGNPAPLLSPQVNVIADVHGVPSIALGPIPAGATVILQHGLHESVLGPVAPTIVFPDRMTPLVVVSADKFNVTITNPSLFAQEASFRAERKHTIEETPQLLIDNLWKGLTPGLGAGAATLKWSGTVNESGSIVTRNLADPGTDGSPGAQIENRYPFGLPHKAMALAIRTHLNTLDVATATINLLKNGAIVASAPAPAAGTSSVTPLAAIPFAAGNDVEVQVVLTAGQSEGGFISLTAVVEFV